MYDQDLIIPANQIVGERRIRGDLLETFKMVTGKVDYGNNVFKLSISCSNIVSKINNCVKNNICKMRKSFLPERIRNYWNNLPAYVKLLDSVRLILRNLKKNM